MSDRLKIGDRVRIETWGTVKDIADAHGSSYGVALDQRDYDPRLDHFRFAWFDKDELRTRRQADLTAEDREALAVLAFMLVKHSHEPYAYDGECVAGIDALDRLLAQGGGR